MALCGSMICGYAENIHNLMVKSVDPCRPAQLVQADMGLHFSFADFLSSRFKKHSPYISMGECNTILSAYTMYRHLE